MKHRVQKKRLGRITTQRKALIRGLLTSLVSTGKVQTTQSRAKVLVSELDALIATVRRQPEKREQIRRVKEVLYTEEAQKILIEKVIPGISRASGVTRYAHLGQRKGDGAEFIQVELYS